MHILLTGADGFIGSALVPALEARGHRLTLCVRDAPAASRRWPGHRVAAMDFVRAQRPEDWTGLLAGVEAVVNAVGIFRERGEQTFAVLHARTPIALFEAGALQGVRRIVQVSALGARDDAVSAFLRSKHAADAALQRMPVTATVVRPSLVFAESGASARLFLRLAALPLIPVPAAATQPIQPIHRDDLVAAIVALLEMEQPPPLLEAVGPERLGLRAFLAALRREMGLGKARFATVPRMLTRLAAAIGSHMPGALFDRDALRMLEQGNQGDVAGVAQVLGHPPRAPERFIERAQAERVAGWARLQWLLPLLRVSVALVWIVTGIVSMGLYPVADSLALLARVGLAGTTALVALYAAAVLDLALGFATLLMRRRRGLYRLQALVILAYTAIITAWLPEFWLHPYGPVLKNLPLLATLWLLHELDGRPRGKEER